MRRLRVPSILVVSLLCILLVALQGCTGVDSTPTTVTLNPGNNSWKVFVFNDGGYTTWNIDQPYMTNGVAAIIYKGQEYHPSSDILIYQGKKYRIYYAYPHELRVIPVSDG
jgi:hypothetical protein